MISLRVYGIASKDKSWPIMSPGFINILFPVRNVKERIILIRIYKGTI